MPTPTPTSPLTADQILLPRDQSLEDAAQTAAIWQATLARLALDSSIAATIRYDDTVYHARLN